MSTPLLQVANLRTELEGPSSTAGAVGTVRAVDDVSFDINASETFALLGESGCGKSMTALSILRLLPDAGRIAGGSVHFDGVDLLGLSEAQMRDVRGGDIAMIFQEPATSLNPVLTVGQQIAEVLKRHGERAPSQVMSRATELLDRVGIPDARRRLDEYPFQLSGGMKQRVMIAMALAREPRLLIADEPTTALDVTIQAQVLALLGRVQQERDMAMLLITHDLGIVHQLAHRIAVMYAGELVEVASRVEFFATPRHPYTRKLFAALPSSQRRGAALETIPGSVPPLTRDFIGCRFADRCSEVMPRCHSEIPPWYALPEGQAVRCHLYDGAPSDMLEKRAQSGSAGISPAPGAVAVSSALLDVRDLQVHFPVRRGILKRVVGQVKAVDGLSLSLATGKTLALVGESGCGKTTAGKAILQLIKPTAGSVRFADDELTTLAPRRLRALRAAMQIIFQDPYASLDPRMRVADIIEEGMTALDVEPKREARQQRLAELLKQVGLTVDMQGRYPHEFSGGQRQRIAIARALAVRPRLLICDEPTSALDVSVQAQILNLLKELQRSLGISYLFITHNIAVVDYLAHEVAVMYLGRIVERGTTEEILRAPKHPYTLALLSAVPRIPEIETPGQSASDEVRSVIVLKGDMPSPLHPPTGCHFHPRCPQVMARCRTDYPSATRLSDTRVVHCHLHSDAEIT